MCMASVRGNVAGGVPFSVAAPVLLYTLLCHHVSMLFVHIIFINHKHGLRFSLSYKAVG